jgi:hypothetical protein
MKIRRRALCCAGVLYLDFGRVAAGEFSYGVFDPVDCKTEFTAQCLCIFYRLYPNAWLCAAQRAPLRLGAILAGTGGGAP